MSTLKPDILSLLVRCLIALSCMAGLVSGAQAQTDPGKWSPQVWINAGAYSQHFDRNNNFRQNNIGLGAEVWFARDHAVMAGTYINSERFRSHYGAYQWRPLHWQSAGIKIDAGIVAGIVDGYPRYRNGDHFPAVLPVLAVEYKRIGVNIFAVPTITNRVDGAISIQFKLRVW